MLGDLSPRYQVRPISRSFFFRSAQRPSTSQSFSPTGLGTLQIPETLGSPRKALPATNRPSDRNKRSPNEVKNAIVRRFMSFNLKKRQEIDRLLRLKHTVKAPVKETKEEVDLPKPRLSQVLPRTPAVLFLRETAQTIQANMQSKGPYFQPFSKYSQAKPKSSARNRRLKALSAISHFVKLKVSPGLISQLSSIVPKQPFGRTQGFAFLMACRQGDISQVKLLLKSDKWLVLDKDYVGQTGLHWAARRNNVDLLSLLLSFGAYIDAKDDLCRTPLCLAVSSNSLSAVRYLLSSRANPFFKTAESTTSKVMVNLLVRGRLLYLMLPWAPIGKRKIIWENEGLAYFSASTDTINKS